MTKQNPPAIKRRARRKAEPRAIYNAIYYTAYRYGCESCGEETLEDIEKAYAAGADVNEPGVDGKPPLMLASEPEKEYEGVVRWLLEHGADVNARDNMGNTALHAARKGSILSLLLQYGADANACNQFGESPLHLAARDYTCFRVSAFLQHGADVHLRSATHGTPLQYVIACNRCKRAVGKLIHTLCAAGADVELPDEEGRTCLHHAARLGDVISAQALLEHGADIHARDAHLRTPLMYAACSDSPEMICLLQSKGAKADAQDAAGCTAAHYARVAQASGMVKLLLIANGEEKADEAVRIPPVSLHRLLFLPLQGRWTSLSTMESAFRVALAGGADPNECWYETQQIVMHHIPVMKKSVLHHIIDLREGHMNDILLATDSLGKIKADRKKRLLLVDRLKIKLARILLDAGADVNAQDAQGDTPLIYALLERRNAQMVHLLLAHGADANARARMSGYTALMTACDRENRKLIPALLAAGADVNARLTNFGWTALHVLMREGDDVKALTTLLEAGADVNARDEDWRTPLMFAARYRRKACLHALLAHGADIAAKDTEGDYALQYMPSFFYFANPDIVQLLTPNSTSHES